MKTRGGGKRYVSAQKTLASCIARKGIRALYVRAVMSCCLGHAKGIHDGEGPRFEIRAGANEALALLLKMRHSQERCETVLGSSSTMQSGDSALCI